MPLINNVQPPDFPRSIVNQSNIGLDGGKIANMPDGWREIDGYKEHFLRDDLGAVRVFEGPWRTRALFYAWALGWSTSVFIPGGPLATVLRQGGIPQFDEGGRPRIVVNNIGAQSFLSRQPPAQHPEYPWLYCTGAELVRGQGAIRNNPTVVLTDNFGNVVPGGPGGRGVPVPMIEYYDSGSNDTSLSAVVALTYRHLDYEVRSDAELAGLTGASALELERYVVRETTGSVQMLPLASGSVKFVKNDAGPPEVKNGLAIPDNAANVLLFGEEWVYTWVDVPDPDWVSIAGVVGRANDAVFDGARGWPTFNPGTLLCQAPQRKRHRSPLGRVTWDIVYRFLFKPTGWNNLPASDGKFWRVTFGGAADGPPLFPAASYDTLFKPPPPVNYQ